MGEGASAPGAKRHRELTDEGATGFHREREETTPDHALLRGKRTEGDVVISDKARPGAAQSESTQERARHRGDESSGEEAQRRRASLVRPSGSDAVIATHLKRCGTILAEFPWLERYFTMPMRNERQQRVHKCSECSYSTLNKTTLMYHVVGVHLTVTPFLCTQGCGFSSGSYNNLRQHETRVHQLRYDRKAPSEDSEERGPDYYMCSGCGARYEAPLDLLRHYFGFHISESDCGGIVHEASDAALQSGFERRALESDTREQGESTEGEDELDGDEPERRRKRRVREVMSIDRLLGNR